ncbi:butyrophilin subfamily 1 member A1-like [Myotis myotis]|uniref:butyrophilin subfamily 1 member A1-like n=1 Tax=Myotis myotis TaxID=51298 RepID=UPI00174929A2|nr:butyrophilin subfamily 1 member A1-like [Myotis myotis]
MPLLLPAGSAEEFMVLGPTEPLVAVLGGDVELPCRTAPARSAENMQLRWFRSKFSEAVLIYEDGREQPEELMAQYAGRTSLVTELLGQGQAAVLIRDVQASDDGSYSCFFREGEFYEEASLELKVAGVGSAPRVRITGPEEDGVRVECAASGWFPKPQVHWRGGGGAQFPAFSEAHAQDARGLFSVEAALVVRDRSVGNVTCSLHNPILGQEKAVAIFIPEPFFPQAPLWKVTFWVSLAALGLLLLGAGYCAHREHSRRLRALRDRETLLRAKEEDLRAKEAALRATEGQAQGGASPRGDQGDPERALQARGLQWDLRLERLSRPLSLLSGMAAHAVLTLFQGNCRTSSDGGGACTWLPGGRPSCMQIGGRRSSRPVRPVTLDPGSADPSLVVSQERRRVTLKETCEDSGGSGSVLGLEGITAGRCHWEVEVPDGDRSEWVLGVCREDVKRTGWYVESPEKGFWVVGQFEDGFCPCPKDGTPLPLRQLPRRVGVFLDYSEGDVSFYDMTEGSHIFSFPRASFSGTLFPYFRLKSGVGSLTICPMAGVSEGLPVPHNNSPCEEPLSPPGSSADGAESPLLPGNEAAAPRHCP